MMWILLITLLVSLIITNWLLSLVLGREKSDSIVAFYEMPTYEPSVLLGANNPTDQLHANTRLIGFLKLRSKVYKDDSHTIQINLRNVANQTTDQETSSDYSRIQLNIDHTVTWLEAELRLSGMEIVGPLIQRRPLHQTANITFSWSVCYKTSGVHAMNILFRSGNETTPGNEICIIEKSIRVNQLNGFVSRQVKILATISAAITAVSGLVVILSKLNTAP